MNTYTFDDNFSIYCNGKGIEKEPIVIYGRGSCAQHMYEFYKKRYNIIGFAETCPEIDLFYEKPVYNPNNIPKQAHIAIASCAVGEISSLLYSMNYRNILNLHLIDLNINSKTWNGCIDKSNLIYIDKNKDTIKYYLNDYESKQSFISACNYRLDYGQRILSKSSYQQYIHPLIKFNLFSTFVDCGAYIGDTYDSLSDKGIFFDNYIAIEASIKNYAVLKNKNFKCNAEIINCCLNDIDSGYSYFSNNGTDSDMIDKNSKIKVINRSIDSILKDNYKDMIIKMDIEGAELPALKGSINIIRKKRPCLLISIYHLAKSIIDIPKFIFSNVNDYTFYCGHHSTTIYDTILYCIPNEYLL